MSGRFPTRALTLWRPWPWVITRGSKRIENRPWPAPKAIVGEYIALHAGKVWDYKGAAAILARHPEMPRAGDDHPVGIVGVARVVDVLSASDDPWFFGPYGWALADVTPIRTVTAKGAMGLWPMSDVMRELVFERWNEARVTP